MKNSVKTLLKWFFSILSLLVLVVVLSPIVAILLRLVFKVVIKE